ncbi:MAG: hypothetical protein FJW32_00670 [Acidobacteria bacterium]|nr:hypothetical protein [Acidobacteriota bacterium]
MITRLLLLACALPVLADTLKGLSADGAVLIELRPGRTLVAGQVRISRDIAIKADRWVFETRTGAHTISFVLEDDLDGGELLLAYELPGGQPLGAIVSWPNWRKKRNMRAEALYRKGDYAAAVREDAELSAGWLQLALERGRSGDAPGKIGALQKAVDLNPLHRETARQYCLAMTIAGRRDSALAHIRRIEPFNPTLATELTTLVFTIQHHR